MTTDKRWIHPQSVPRGILRLYILSLVSRGPESGYSVMQTIEDKTEGAWRPGPGTVYPLLRGLVKDGLLKPLEKGKREGTIAYAITPKGSRELQEMQRILMAAGRKERVMIRLLADLLSSEVFTRLFVSRQRDMFDLFVQKVSQVPQPDRDSTLKEMRNVLENQLSHIDSMAEPLREKRGR